MRISDWSSDVCSSDLTSSHRSYAISEKSAPGNGITDPNDVLDAGRNAAKRFYCLDLQALADKAGSVISASLFGALAGSGALPRSEERRVGKEWVRQCRSRWWP